MDFLFDIGNVILEVDFHSSLHKILPPGGDARRVMQILLERKDDLESGRIDNDEFLDWAIATTGTTASREEFVAAWLDVFRPVDPMWHTIRRLSGEGHRLILFSNTNDLHASHAFRRYEIFDLFPHAVFSHLVGAMKPDPAIYQHAITNYGLDPAGTIYVDDLPENIATGLQLGFRAWQYHAGRHADFEDWLARQLESC